MQLSDPKIRDAIEEDECFIFQSLTDIIALESGRKDILQLQEQDAQGFIDLIQMALDRNKLQDVELQRIAQRLVMKLCEKANTLPSSLVIEGVELRERDAIYGGGFADIYRGSYQGKDVALKRMRIFQRGQDRQKMHKNLCREALIWQRLQHPHVLPFLGVDSSTFAPFLCMISPWMQHGTIMKHLEENGSVNISRRLFEVALGLEYLHSQNIVHGDLRGGNILVNDEWQACLADFGLTIVSEATVATFTSHTHGSTRWMAPELHDPESFNLLRSVRTPASDIYSFACVCLEIFTGRAPFHDTPNNTTVILKVLKGQRPKRPRTAGQRAMPDETWKLVERCWSHQPWYRPTTREVVNIMRRHEPSLSL
ncbi:kinase-like domain-containing protein [Crucibulum laeve]|uniref:Kinase-like domain-containing protein n=1 Tax=Crucibulum laeve TaxID=68775 RepID=A0A5C3MPR4_9AGAR|nr:kinase-like domain-containing protein [Crucibulum laeve]